MCHPGGVGQLVKEAEEAKAARAAQALVGDREEDAIVLDEEPEATALAPRPPPPPRGSPVILQLDSLGSYHKNVEGVLRAWLACEWAAKKGGTSRAAMQLFSAQAGHLRFVEAVVPQQENNCDCGVFVAEFARRFCCNPPPVLSLSPADGWPYMLKRTWFDGEVAAGDAKREHIHRTILALDGVVKAPPALPGGAPEVMVVLEEDDVPAPAAAAAAAGPDWEKEFTAGLSVPLDE